MSWRKIKEIPLCLELGLDYEKTQFPSDLSCGENILSEISSMIDKYYI